MMGLSVVADSGAIESARAVVNIINLLTDRKAVALQLQELLDAMEKYNRVRAELEQLEHSVLLREKQVQALEDGLDRKRRAADEHEQSLQHREQRVKEQQAALDALKAGLRQKWAA
jgi:chromosome segregation ATPase